MKKSLNILVTVLVIFSVILSFAGCAKGNTPAKSNDARDAEQTITIGVMPDMDSIPFIIADQKGYFKEQGVKVTIEHFKSAADRDSALQAGKLDGEITDILALMFARESGLDLRITSSSVGDYKMVVGKDSGITKSSDLKGKSVAISINTLIEYATDKILQESNLKIEDIKKMAVPQIPARLEMLQNGKVDAATLPDPLATVAVQNGASLLNSTGKLGINPGIIAFTQKSIETKEKEVAAVYRAYNQAIEYLQKEAPESYMDMIVKEAGFPQDVKDVLTLPKFEKAQMAKEKDINDVIKWMEGKQLIKNQYNIKDLINDKFIK